MEIFRKGSDPPLIFGSYETRQAQFNFDHKKGKNQIFPKYQKVSSKSVIFQTLYIQYT